MTIEIEAGASQPQCSTKRSRRPSFFEDVFLMNWHSMTTSIHAVTRASPVKMRVLGGNSFLNRFAEALVLLINDRVFGTVRQLLYYEAACHLRWKGLRRSLPTRRR